MRLRELLVSELECGRRALVGFDFPFGFPVGVAERLTGEASASALWAWLASRVEDAGNNLNNRYRVATEINDHYPGVGPCWGRPAMWSYPAVPTRAKDRTDRAAHPPERRIADEHAKGAKTVWQLAYAGSVGSQVLVGLPILERLRRDPTLAPGIAVWPFDSGLRVPDRPLVLAEVYPSLLKGLITKNATPGEIPDAAQVRVNAEAFAALDRRNGLAPVFGGPKSLTIAERCRIEAEEAWILGLGHEAALT